MDRNTGRKIEAAAHLAQSILDILTTPKGSRLMRRDYGSDLPDIIDQPINGNTLIDVYQATAEALDLWEPRISLARVEVLEVSPGMVELRLLDEAGKSIDLPVGELT